MRSILAFLIVCFIVQAGFSQSSVNQYKYVIVESQFHFQNEPNEYDLNRMVRFQFEKLGFKAYIEGQTLPDELKDDYCKALRSVIRSKGALRTKATIELYDCNNYQVYQSPEGITREKEFKRAYELAIRKAFEYMEGLNYSYQPRSGSDTKTKEDSDELKDAKTEIAQLKKEVSELKNEKESEVEENTDEVSEVKQEQLPVMTEQPDVTSSEPTAERTESGKSAAQVEQEPESNTTYISATISVRGKDESVKLIQSTNSSIYLLKDQNALLYQAGAFWILLKHSDGVVTEEPVRVKFQ